jgi:predicted dehydrogenase
MINENFRWQAWYRQAKEMLASGALGAPFLARLTERTRFTLPSFSHPQAYLAEMPRLAVYELGVHFLDTFRFLFGEPETIFARLHHVSPHVKGEDVQLITLGYRHMTALIQHSWASVPVPMVDTSPELHDYPPPPRLEIEGTEGTLILQADSSMRLYTDSGQKEWLFSRNARPEGHIAAQQHFINCLNQGAEFETSGLETLKTMALVYAAYLSAEEGRVVPVS